MWTKLSPVLIAGHMNTSFIKRQEEMSIKESKWGTSSKYLWIKNKSHLLVNYIWL